MKIRASEKPERRERTRTMGSVRNILKNILPSLSIDSDIKSPDKTAKKNTSIRNIVAFSSLVTCQKMNLRVEDNNINEL